MGFMPAHKNWFQGFGLHHATITALGILLGHYIGAGPFMAIFGMGWYGNREYGNGPYPPKTFEIMDFISPTFISAIYLIGF